MASERLEELYALVRRIPEGYVVSYGAIGRAMKKPVSGLLVGKWMANCPPDLPWWRVVGADGSIKTWGRGPEVGAEQVQKLREEGIEFDDILIQKQYFMNDIC
jgi:methylated-DNA-protein-cysteine methyltransferase related protein